MNQTKLIGTLRTNLLREAEARADAAEALVYALSKTIEAISSLLTPEQTVRATEMVKDAARTVGLRPGNAPDSAGASEPADSVPVMGEGQK